MQRYGISISFLLLAIAALTPEFIQGAALPAEAEDGLRSLKYIGSLTTSTKSRGNVVQAVSHYFLSQNAAAYATAASDCRANLGDAATLVYIETEQELADVAKLLRESDDTGSSYWLGGRFDPDNNKFVWESDVDIEAWAPWDQGHPDTRTAVTRVAARNVGSLKLRTQFNTVSTRYICELQTN